MVTYSILFIVSCLLLTGFECVGFEIHFPLWNKSCENVDGECLQLSNRMRGNFAFDKFEHINLYDPRNYSQYCPSNSTTKFTSCWGPYQNVKIYNGLRIDSSTIPKFQYKYLKNPLPEEFQTMTMNTQFIGDLFAVPNAYINRWGQTFDTKYRYLSGRCSDTDHENPPYTIESAYQEKKVRVVEDIVLNLVIPWSYAFGHEMLEVYELLYFLKPLLLQYPRIAIAGFEGMMHDKFFPLLELNELPVKTYNQFYTLYSHRNIIHAPWIIIPPTPCLFIPSFYPEQLHRVIEKLPFPTTFSGNNILIHDRRNQQPSRYIPEGKDIETALRARYAGKRDVLLLHGTESLPETIKLMRSSQVFISIHSSATSNMIFMNPGSVYVEISPSNHHLECMMQLAIANKMTAYYYPTYPGDWRDVIHVNATEFLAAVIPLIDQLKLTT
jgi:hypothetical protein